MEKRSLLAGNLHPLGKTTFLCLCAVNPLSPNSDQHQFSPNNIHVLPREMVMRVNKMIGKEKML